MKPTLGPDPAMPEEYGMYNGDYEGYDEDEFFYHMYFDEVSTTPVPEEFYDILEYVSNSEGNSFNNYPDYFDYIRGGSGLARNKSDSELSTQPSLRQNKNKRYLQFGDLSSSSSSSSNNSRRNSKFLQFKKRKEAASEAKAISKRSDSLTTTSKKLSSEAARVRTKRASKKNKKNKKKKGRVGFRKRKQLEPGVIGILDRRIPIFFRQSPFVSIALTQFVILSTGVTTGKRGHFNLFDLRPET